MKHSKNGQPEDPRHWSVEGEGKSPIELLSQLEQKDWYVSRDARELVRSLSAISSLLTRSAKLLALTPSECGVSSCSTHAVIATAKARDLRLATPEIALLLALQHDPCAFGASYVVTMHEPVLVRSNSHMRPRLLAISLEGNRPGIVAPRALADRGWEGDRMFMLGSPI